MPHIQYTLPAEGGEWLEGRAERAASQRSASLRAKAELAIWRDVLAAEARRTVWDLSELGFLAEISMGTIYSSAVGSILAGEAGDAEDGLFDGWGLDRDAFLAKLSGLGPAQDAAMRDILQRRTQEKLLHNRQTWESFGLKVAADG